MDCPSIPLTPSLSVFLCLSLCLDRAVSQAGDMRQDELLSAKCFLTPQSIFVQSNGQMGTHGLNLARKFAGAEAVYVDGGACHS